MSEQILIVDDEKEIADLIEVYLKNDGYTVHKFYNGLDALECIETQKMDLAILDVMLPDIDGFRICQKIREQYYYPIIMLTAKVEDTDKIMGLTIGADESCGWKNYRFIRRGTLPAQQPAVLVLSAHAVDDCRASRTRRRVLPFNNRGFAQRNGRNGQ